MNAMQRNTMITTNGAATRMVRLCRPDRASSPPTSSMMIATAPITEPQKITTHLDGSSVPRCDSVPVTIDAASAPETKKIATRIMTSSPVKVAHG